LGYFLFRTLALGNIRPIADNLDRMALIILYQAQFVMDPAVAAIPEPESVFMLVMAMLEQQWQIRNDAPGIIRMDMIYPEA
jgi:hypothetical protein